MVFLGRLYKLVEKRREIVESKVDKPRKRKKSVKQKVNHSKLVASLKHPELFKDLDDGQKSAILSENPRTLVLAGAGAGKTRVLLNRILHLILNKDAKSSNILAMTFTKDATHEMIDRLIAYFEPKYADALKKSTAYELKVMRQELQKRHPEIRNITVRTIHSLCYSIIRRDGAKVYNTRFKVVGDAEKTESAKITQQQVIKNIIQKLGEDPEFAEKVKMYILDYLVHLDNDPKLEETKDPGLKYVTLDLKRVRSKSERDIGNFLYQQGIRYEYEKEVDWVEKKGNKSYHPDFYLPDYDIYIEHWLVGSEKDKVDKVFSKSFNKKRYLKEREWKLDQFKKHNKTLIESCESQMQGNISEYYDNLYQQIKEKTGNAIKYRSSKDFIQELSHLRNALAHLITGIMKIVNLAKSNRVDVKQIEENLKEEKHAEVLEFYDIFNTVYEEYEKYLVENSLIDFNDMIHKVIGLFTKYPEIRKKYQKQFKHILVDEYQDVSAAQVELIKLLLDKDNNLFAVGDDWQSIYGFRGSEVDFIINFEKEFKNAKTIILPYNYRSGKDIVEASNIVIMKNPQQVTKEIKPFKKDKTEKIYQFDALNDIDGAAFIIQVTRKLIEKGHKPKDILVLYRRSVHISQYREFFKKNNFRVNIKTIHGSKGLEAKIVFLVGLKSGSYGFPYVWEDERIVQVVKKTDLCKKEEEERRIFYVAMTRAKEKLFLISEKHNQSEYCDDIPECYKRVELSKSEFNEEMLTDNLRTTLDMLKNGKSKTSIAEERGVLDSVIETHIAKMIELGILDTKDFVDKKKFAIIKKNIPDKLKNLRLKPIKEKMPKSISYGEIRYVIAEIKKKRNNDENQVQS